MYWPVIPDVQRAVPLLVTTSRYVPSYAVAVQDVRASSTGSGLESERVSDRGISREQMVNELQWLLNLEPINIYMSRYTIDGRYLRVIRYCGMYIGT